MLQFIKNKLDVQVLPRFILKLDPIRFQELKFYRALEEIGYNHIFFSGTGWGRTTVLVNKIRNSSELKVILHPANSSDLCKTDLIVLPVIMNTNSPYLRPFGTESINSAIGAKAAGLNYLNVAYFVLGPTQMAWHHQTFDIPSSEHLYNYCLYSHMLGFKYIWLDYEGAVNVDLDLIKRLKAEEGLKLIVSGAFSQSQTRELYTLGVDTVMLSGQLLLASDDPLALAKTFYDNLMAKG